jgi:hypothetical protein
MATGAIRRFGEIFTPGEQVAFLSLSICTNQERGNPE